MTIRVGLAVVLGVCVATAHAQPPTAPAPQPPPGSAAQPASPVDPAPTPPPDFVYSVAGRRDPFVPTVARGVASVPTGTRRPPGVAGLMVGEIVVRGLLESQGAWVAMIGAPDGRTYTLRTGDHLMDGTVRTITSEAVVILQQISDSPSVAKQREVRKLLRGGEQVQ